MGWVFKDQADYAAYREAYRQQVFLPWLESRELPGPPVRSAIQPDPPAGDTSDSDVGGAP